MNALIVLNHLKHNGKPKSTAQDTAKKLQAVDAKALESLALIIRFNIQRSVLDVRRSSLLPRVSKAIAIQLVATFIRQCVREISKSKWVANYARHLSIRFTSVTKVFASYATNTFI